MIEIVRMKYEGKSYFSKAWNTIEMFRLVLYIYYYKRRVIDYPLVEMVPQDNSTPISDE